MRADLSEGGVEILPLSEAGAGGGPREWMRLLGERLYYPRVEMLPEGVIGELILPEEKYAGQAAVLSDLEKRTGEHRGIPVSFFLKKDTIVLAAEEPDCLLLSSRLSVHIQEEGMEPVRFLLRMLDSIIKEDMRILQNLEGLCYRMEEELLSGEEEGNPSLLMSGNRKSLRERSFLYQQLLVCSDAMAENACGFFTDAEVGSMLHFGAKVERLGRHAEMIREYMVQLRELYQQRLDEQQNRTMRLLTVVTTIFFPLKLITGWYGMNFVYMPELHSPYSYGILAIICLFLLVGEIVLFKWKRFF